MSTPTIRLITGREIADRLRNRAYVVGTLVSAVGIAAAVALTGVFGGDDPQRFHLGIAGTPPAGFEDALPAIAAAHDVGFDVTGLADRATAASAVTAGDIDAALVDGVELMVDGPPDPALHSIVETARQHTHATGNLEAAGLSGAQIASVLAPAEPLRITGPDGGEGTEALMAWIIAMAATALLFGTVMTNAGSLLTGAVEEKSSRVVEVLLATVRPWQLLAGKIIALTALALAQLGLVVGAALGTNAAVGAFTLPPATTATVAVSLVMLLLGFTFFAGLYTVAGSLAATAQDAQGSAGPLSFLVMATYGAVIFAVFPNPTGLWAQALTYLPPTAPFTVPARVAFDAIPLWQVAASAGITLLAVVATIAIAGRLYAASLLAGGKLSWRQAWQSEPIT